MKYENHAVDWMAIMGERCGGCRAECGERIRFSKQERNKNGRAARKKRYIGRRERKNLRGGEVQRGGRRMQSSAELIKG